jgi:hypothetical protein
MADDELKLRITPEVDEDALKRIGDELDRLHKPLDAPVKPSKGASDAIKKDIQTRIDLRDLELRRIQTASAEEIKFLQQRASQGKITTTQMVADIQLVENAQEVATQNALKDYNALQSEIMRTTELTKAQATALEKKLFFAQERANTGFVSMSRSMGGLTSSTKSANIAFANFGRIVQDAPFGLLGISNNIDPLLVSFAQVRKEAGSTGKAFAQIGSQLLGPAGLIFLIGSVLPTALLLGQKAFKEFGIGANDSIDGVKEAVENMVKSVAAGFAEAASGKSYMQLTREWQATVDEIKRQQDRLNEIYIEEVSLVSDTTEAGKIRRTQLKNEGDLIRGLVKEYEVFKGQYEAQIATANARARLDERLEDLQIGAAKRAEDTAKEAEGLRREREQEEDRIARLAEQRADERQRLDRSLSQLFDDELTQRIKREQESVQEILNSDQLTAQERINVQTYYNGISERLTQEHNDKLAEIEADSLRKRLDEEQKAREESERISERAKREAESKLEATQDFQLQVARISGEQRLAVEKDYEIQAYDLDKRAKELGLSDTKEFKDALVALERQKFNDLTAISIAETATIAKGGLAIAESIFGESKLLASANVAISTIEGAFAAYANTSKLAPFPFGNALGLAASAVVVSQGMASIKEINKKRIGDSSVKKMSGGGGASIASATQKPFVTDAISPSGANIAGRIGAMNNQPQFNVTATVDRMGLALAVRDGESDISTRQIPFAS